MPDSAVLAIAIATMLAVLGAAAGGLIIALLKALLLWAVP